MDFVSACSIGITKGLKCGAEVEFQVTGDMFFMIINAINNLVVTDGSRDFCEAIDNMRTNAIV